MPPPDGSGPLAGVKILDLTRWQNGPTATLMFADYGADVIKLEPPLGGDPGRKNQAPDGYQWYTEAFNRGKRSITLDLKAPQARPIMMKLVQWADVMCDNFVPGTLEKFGYSYDTCKSWNPSIIYASNSGFGPVGRWRDNRCYDIICQGISGAAVSQGGGPDHEPTFVEWGAADQVGAMSFAFAIASALIQRSQHPKREGQWLETSQLGAMINFQAFWLQTYLHFKKQRNDGNKPWSGGGALAKYKCADGAWLILSHPEDKMWAKLWQAIDKEDFINDSRTKNAQARMKNNKFICDELANIFATKSRDHWIQKLSAYEVPCGPAYSYADLEADPHMWDNGYFKRVPHSRYDDNVVINIPAKFHSTPAGVQANAPDLGEHTEEVLSNIVGLNEEEIAALSDEGIIKPELQLPFKLPPKKSIASKL